MSTTTVEKIDGNQVKVTLNLDAEKFEEGLKAAYNKGKHNIAVPGFRKGKAPRAIIEKQYGSEIFYEEAINCIFPDEYEKAVEEHSLEVVSSPEVDVIEVDKEKGAILAATVTVKPEVTLGEYKGLTYTDISEFATDEDVYVEIQKELEKNSRLIAITDRPVEKDDIVTIDYEGFIDGVAFQGGKDSDHKLTIGSKSFIDTFEDQLIGKNIGDSVEVNVTFPESYGTKELAGKPALFNVDIKEIEKKEFPDLDDEFARDVSEFDTLEQYKFSIKEAIEEEKRKEKENTISDELVKKAIENIEVDVPPIMIENQMNQMVNDFDRRLQSSGLSIDTYLQYMRQDYNTFKESYRESAEFNTKARLTLEAIAKLENIESTDEEVTGEILKIAESVGVDADKMKSMMRPQDIAGIRGDLKAQKALKIIVDSASPEKQEIIEAAQSDESTDENTNAQEN